MFDVSQFQSDLESQGVVLVAVTKEVGVEKMTWLLEQGVSDIAENRVQVAQEKFAILEDKLDGVKKHFIGNIQKKAKEIVQLFDVIQSVSSEKQYNALCKHAANQQKHIEILLQLHLTDEPSKFGGFQLTEFESLLSSHKILNTDFVSVRGIMAMGALESEGEGLRKVFMKAKQISDQYSDQVGSVLSLGMSGDYEIAIEEGSTMVRVGTMLFS